MKLLPIFLSLACALAAETVKDREGAVRNDKAAMEKDARWIYNDAGRGFAEARRTGKPLLVVLRCVPCLACAGIDAQVLLQETELSPLLDQFVCVRVINANALDLSRFQFDYDLSFSTLFFHGDGTVLGRYGSWTHQKNAQENSTASFRLALEEALRLHRGYPANKARLETKQGLPIPFKTPVEIPSLADRYKTALDWEGKVVQSCVHCHMIGDAIRTSYRDKGELIPQAWVYPQPAPEAIGLSLAMNEPAKIEAVAADSIAARAGLRAGDRINLLGGAPMSSIADVSWALHVASDEGELRGLVNRSGQSTPLKFTLTLPPGWRAKSDISRRVGTWPMRAMAFGGLVLEDLDDAGRASRGLSTKDLALFVKHAGQYGIHAAAKNAGFQKDDVLVAIDGLAQRMGEGELLGVLLQKHRPGEKVGATVLRGAEHVNLTLPMQ